MECGCGEPPGYRTLIGPFPWCFTASPRSGATSLGLARGSFRKQGGQDPGERLEVVPASADRVAGRAEERQHHADYDDDDTDRPENGDPGDEADNEEKNAEDNHEELLAAVRSGEGRDSDIYLGDDAHGGHGGLPPAG